MKIETNSLVAISVKSIGAFVEGVGIRLIYAYSYYIDLPVELLLMSLREGSIQVLEEKIIFDHLIDVIVVESLNM